MNTAELTTPLIRPTSITSTDKKDQKNEVLAKMVRTLTAVGGTCLTAASKTIKFICQQAEKHPKATLLISAAAAAGLIFSPLLTGLPAYLASTLAAGPSFLGAGVVTVGNIMK